MFLVAVAGQVVLSACALPASAGQLEIHYAPTENLERVDTELLRSALARIAFSAAWACLSAASACVMSTSKRHARPAGLTDFGPNRTSRHQHADLTQLRADLFGLAN